MGMARAATHPALLVALIALGLVFIHPAQVRAARPAGPAGGEWVQSFYLAGCGYSCSSFASVVVPSYDLVIGFDGLGDVAARSLSDPPQVPVILQDGAPPSSPVIASVFDPQGGRILVFRLSRDFEEMTTWALSLGDTLRWERLETTGSPIWSASSSAVHDSRRGRIILFGGMQASQAGIWSLSLRDLHWTRLSPSGYGLEARLNHSAIYDPVGDRVIIYGGERRIGDDGLGDVWALSFGGLMPWHRLAPAGDVPRGRFGHSAIYDPRGHRMVVFGGLSTFYPPTPALTDTWELSLAGRPVWKELVTRGDARATPGRGAAYDPSQDRMVIGTTWGISSLVWGRHEGPSLERAPPAKPFAAPRNIERSASTEPWWSGFPLGGELRVYDLQGRLVLTREVSDAEDWLASFSRGATGSSQGMVAGVYFAQVLDPLRQHTWHRTVVLQR